MCIPNVCFSCGRSEHETKLLRKGLLNVRTILNQQMPYYNFNEVPNDLFAWICEDCDNRSHNNLPSTRKDIDFSKPRSIKKYLDEYVVEQERAKKKIAVAIHDHYQRTIKLKKKKKHNILMIGPTGCGKTLLARTAAEILNVPFAEIDANAVTEAGYVGENVEECLVSLFRSAKNNLKLAEKGVVYIDEIDKIAKKGDTNAYKDVSGEGVQNALLKMIEGTVVKIPINGGHKTSSKSLIAFDTTNVLFICSGAFSGLYDIVEERGKQKQIGFKTDSKQAAEKANIKTKDLIQYGMIPELLGRLPARAILHELNDDALIKVLTEPRNSLVSQEKNEFEANGIRLIFTEGALRALVKKAKEYEGGARGLETAMEELLLDIKYDLFSEQDMIGDCIITKEVVAGKEQPLLQGAMIELKEAAY